MYLQELNKKYAYIHKYVIYAFIIFILSTFIGYYTAYIETEKIRIIFNQLISDSKVLGEVGPVTLFIIIFLNNSIKSFFATLLGVFFGVAPLILLIANGYVLGTVSYFIIEEFGINPLVWGILPHGVIELPLLIITTSYGLWLGNSFINKIRYKTPIKQDVRIAIQMFSKYFIPLFFFAAFIEVFITDFFLTAVI